MAPQGSKANLCMSKQFLISALTRAKISVILITVGNIMGVKNLTELCTYAGINSKQLSNSQDMIFNQLMTHN